MRKSSKDKKTDDPEAVEAEPEAEPEIGAVIDGEEKEESKDDSDIKVNDNAENSGSDNAEAEDTVETECIDENTDNSNTKIRVAYINHAYDGLLPVSLLAALIGALLGIIPATLLAYLTGILFYPFFIAAPLLAYLFNSLLKGGRDIRALVVTAVFSLACAYITALACQAALYTSAHNMSIFQILLLTGLELGESGVLPASASAYIYPLVFTVFGVAVVGVLLLSGERRVERAAP